MWAKIWMASTVLKNWKVPKYSKLEAYLINYDTLNKELPCSYSEKCGNVVFIDTEQ